MQPPRAEARLLLDACRVAPLKERGAAPSIAAATPATRPAAAPAAAVSPSQPDIDWERLLAAAERHAVAPLLARHLASSPCGAPSHVLAALRARYDVNALRNITLARHLAELLRGLAAHGVKAMPVKGPALAIAAYGDLALREFGDLDVVVHPGDFDRARALLGEWGYVPVAALSGVGERTLRATDHHLPLVGPDDGVKVELHWTLGRGRLGRDDAWVWSNVRPVLILGLEAPTLSWSALLVYLCAHGAAHCWLRLGWIRDVAGVLQAAPAGELRGAVELAAAASCRRRLALGIALAHELLGAPVPEGLEQGDDDATIALLAGQVRTALFAEDGKGIAGWMAFQCRTLDTILDRAGYCLHVLAAPHVADVEAVALPGWLRGLYYVVRPARLLAIRAGARRTPRPSGPGGDED